ncbi:LysR family transcriptional regulator [Sinomonas halotolerans]|uniref:LysR family transcriptional regulator n=1 Tax=Sinomonas halotolerans TaxID=1644133 RepID=A0ABU9WXS0_9MICC
MNFRRLQYFLAVVDAGTVTAAAETLLIAQPALSRQIKTLERELRLALFEPQGNRLVLTSAGRALVPVARRLMVETRGFEEAAAALRTGRVEQLVAATTSASLRGFLAPFIATTSPDDPRIIPREVAHFEMSGSLRQGCDFAISPAAPEGPLRSVPLGRVALKAYVAPDHPWADRKEISLPALGSEHVILPSHHSVSRYILDEALSREGTGLERVTECDDGQTIMALAAAGHGIGITTDQPLYGARPVRLLGAGGSPLDLGLHVAWLPGHFAEDTISGIAARLRGFLREAGAVIPAGAMP